MRKLILALLFCISAHSAFSQINLPEFHYTPVTPSYNNNQSYKSSYPALESYSNPLLKERIPLPEFNYSRTNTVLENGWYDAEVTYYNPRTETKSIYALDVQIHNDRVVAISFGEDGSIHTGDNNSGYSYSGGDLTFYKNKSGKIVSADTTVKIYTNAGSTYFNIKL